MLHDLLVHVDDSRACPGRLNLASRVARDFEAHLTGLYVTPRYEIPAYVHLELPPEALQAQARGLQATADRARTLFADAVRRVGLGPDWRVADGHAPSMVSLHARYADLVILGQSDPDDPAAAASAGVAEEVLLSAGRPVLLVPYAGTFTGACERVLVAWNASREAARAVNDALPFLQRARQVTVLAVNPRVGETAHGEVPGADIALHLARHGVEVAVSNIHATDLEVGDILLSRCADLGTDLIVMGAYGRSRFRELVLGGVTRQLLDQMTVPVLASH